MKTEITPKDYIDYYEACSWDPIMFEKLLRHFGYDFGNLTVVDHLDLRGTRITHLVGIKTVIGRIILMKTNIISLGDLEEVSGYLDLTNTPIETLGKLQKVGGNLYLRDTPITKKYSEKEIRQMVNVGKHISIDTRNFR